MGQFKTLSDYKGAELQAALTNAIVAAFTESALDQTALLELFGGDAEALIRQRAEYVVKMKAGAVIPLFPGDSFASHAPARPNAAFGPFVDNVLKHIQPASTCRTSS
ncbi:phage portal protein [Tianweitania sediminis]|uniref:Phage portal protein n=1 Tax=Tianweitania sediminis TaxID=1502156 RepID=A0A8J7UM27_9HYPH|nr:phage portal protein [Tianweitania sediminis]